MKNCDCSKGVRFVPNGADDFDKEECVCVTNPIKKLKVRDGNKCEVCEGDGILFNESYEQGNDTMQEWESECYECNGSGEIANEVNLIVCK